MQGPDGSFTVTLADVYAEVRRCQDAVLSMQPQASTLNDHETRIRSVERWKYALPIVMLIELGNTAVAILALIKR